MKISILIRDKQSPGEASDIRNRTISGTGGMEEKRRKGREEKETNLFLRANSIEEFTKLRKHKDNWSI